MRVFFSDIVGKKEKPRNFFVEMAKLIAMINVLYYMPYVVYVFCLLSRHSRGSVLAYIW